MTNDEPRKVEMSVTQTSVEGNSFVFDMHARSNVARTVRFAIDHADAVQLYEALESFLKSDFAKK